jgi:RHS repeat-associated protein
MPPPLSSAIIASKDKTQAQQKRYRYTDKERDDSNGLCYYGARYLAPWLARWISPDSAGEGFGLCRPTLKYWIVGGW